MHTIKQVFIILLVSWASCSPIWAQVNFNGYKVFGGSGADENPSLIKTPDGGYLLAFESTSTDGDGVGNHGGRDIVLMKLNQKRERIWSRSYGGYYNEKLGDLLIDDAGYIYVCATTESNDGDLPTQRKGSADRWAFKLNPNGSVIWSKVYGGSNVDYGTWISRRANGNLLIGGSSLSQDQDVNINYGQDDSWICELSANGDLIWSQSNGSSDADRDFVGFATRDNGFLAGIRVTNDDGSIIGSSHGGSDLWFVKCDSDKIIEWQTLLGGWDCENNIGDAIEVDDGYIFIAETSSGDGILANASCKSSMETNNVFVCKINQMGVSEWARCITAPIPFTNQYSYYEYPNFGRSLFPTEDGGVLVFSQSYQDECPIPEGTDLPHSILVTKLSSIGSMEWQKPIGSYSSYTSTAYLSLGSGVWLAAIQSVDFKKTCSDSIDEGLADKDIWLTELVDCNNYIADRPSGDEQVCLNSSPITQYEAESSLKPLYYVWSLTPFDAGSIGSNDSITTVEWNPSFSGEAKLSVSLVTECGTSRSSDSLLINVYRDCTGIDDFMTERMKVYFYPNPASGNAILHYALPVGTDKARIRLYDMSGCEVYNGEISASEDLHRIDISHLSGGVYQCTIEGAKASGRCRLVVL